MFYCIYRWYTMITQRGKGQKVATTKTGTNDARRVVCALSEDSEELETQTRLEFSFFSLYTYVNVVILVVRRFKKNKIGKSQTRQTLTNPCCGWGFVWGCNSPTRTRTPPTRTRNPSRVGKPVTIPKNHCRARARKNSSLHSALNIEGNGNENFEWRDEW